MSVRGAPGSHALYNQSSKNEARPGSNMASGTPQQGRCLRILMVATSYPADLNDWRGLFIRHMVGGLARRDDLKLDLWAPPGQLPEHTSYAASDGEARWLERLMQDGGVAHQMRTGGLRGLLAPIQLLRKLRAMYRRVNAVDVYHVNWLQNALVLPRNSVPLLATVLGTDMQLLKLPGMVALLRRVLRHRRCVICPNASWMVARLEECFGDLAEIRFVPFGIDPAWFVIQRGVEMPEKWLCVARLTEGKIGSLFEWGESFFAGGERELHLFGPMQQAMKVPDWVNYHGPATPASLCNEWFPRATGMITLSSHAEGRPQVMLEAMAAGLPIIASRIPAHADFLTHGQTGWLCSAPDEFGGALTALADPDRNMEMGRLAREWALREIGTWDDCAARYHDIYARLVRV